MPDVIKDCLGDRWAMFYTEKMPIHALSPNQTLDKSIYLVNETMEIKGRELTEWNEGLQDEAARLVWVNYIYHRLDREPIKKPIISHYHHGIFHVDCGDTRLMSQVLHDPQAELKVAVTCDLKDIKRFNSWKRIRCDQDLRDAAGFEKDAVIMATSAEDWCFYWLEIGDSTTAHHPHSFQDRVIMMHQYLRQQDPSFRFSKEWFLFPIDWEAYRAIA